MGDRCGSREICEEFSYHKGKDNTQSESGMHDVVCIGIYSCAFLCLVFLLLCVVFLLLCVVFFCLCVVIFL